MQILFALWIEELHKKDLVDNAVDLDDFRKLIVWIVIVEQHQIQPSIEHSNVAQPDYICVLTLKRKKKINDKYKM